MIMKHKQSCNFEEGERKKYKLLGKWANSLGKYHMQLARKRKMEDISLKYVVDMSIF